MVQTFCTKNGKKKKKGTKMEQNMYDQCYHGV